MKTGRHPEEISKIKPFIDKCNWEGINYPSESDGWKKLRKITIAFNGFILKTKKYTLSVFRKKTQSMKNTKIILLMIPSGEGWHYLTVKNDLDY